VSIVELAEKARPYLSGIPWAKITNDPYRDVYTEVRYYVPLAQAMREVMEFADHVDWTWDVYDEPDGQDAMVAWYGVRESILSKDSLIMAAINANKAHLTGSEAPTMDLEIWRAFCSQMFSFAMRGFVSHQQLLFQYGGADPAVIVNNADKIHALCKVLRMLWNTGALNPISRKYVSVEVPAVQNKAATGAIQVPAITVAGGIIIGVVVIAVVYIIAWFIQNMTVIASQQRLANQACAEAMADPTNKAKAKACQSAQNFLNEAKPDDPSSMYNTLAIFGGIGILMYVGSMVLPDLLKRRREG
jgi:hypothetical protein